MKKKVLADGVLVYDRYYCSRPRTALLVAKRVLMACALSVCGMMYIFTEYGTPVSMLFLAVVCAAFTAVFSLVFVFFRKLPSVAVIAAAAGAAVYFTFEELVASLAYFADWIMLCAEGRFIFPRRYLFHSEALLTAEYPDFLAGVQLGCVLMCGVFSLVCALCAIGRSRAFPAAAVLIVYCVPCILSEHLEFNLWLIPALAMLWGFAAIGRSYSGGLAVKHSGSGPYRKKVRREEKRILGNMEKSSPLKRVEMHCNYYSKYFSVGMYCAALFAAAAIVGAAIFGDGGYIDYAPLYEFVSSIGDRSSISATPFEDGPVSDYFARPDPEEDVESTLNIVSPGSGEREIIRVSFTGDRPVYLRGDIGVDFTGTSWTTPVSGGLKDWEESRLSNVYRPCELRVVQAMLDASESLSGLADVIAQSDLSIDYLCSTDVVFLPPYTVEYSYYESDSFTVYGDLAVRVNDPSGNYINTVQCSALVPSYTGTETRSGFYSVIYDIERVFLESGFTVNDIYSTVIPSMRWNYDIISDYEAFVEENYLGISTSVRRRIEAYMQRSGLSAELETMLHDHSDEIKYESVYRYLAAEYIANYLRDNYTYSLDGGNGGNDPVMQFLEVTKRGHCSLYATAMTLMLRDMGIPARYCTGFYVMAPEGESGGGITLREKNLHAWVEVYLGQLGWVTFDPTSSSVFTDRPGDAHNEAEPPVSRPEQTRDEPDIPNIRPDISEEVTEQAAPPDISESVHPEPEQPIGIWVYMLAASAALAVIILLPIIQYFSLRNGAAKAIGKLRKTDSPKASALIYRVILDICKVCGITPDYGELPREFFGRADKAFGSDLAELAPLLEAAEFGRHPLTYEQRDQLIDTMLNIYAKALSTKNIIRKIRIMKAVRSGGNKL